MAEFIPADRVVWRHVGYLRDDNSLPFEYHFDLPCPLADWDVWDYWERARVHSMREHLEQGMVLFDVGTEQGWCNLVYANMVGPENMVLVEPTPEFWPNIRATWERNYGVEPRACYDGLFSDKTVDARTTFVGWPQRSTGPLIDRNKYQYIHEHSDGIPEIRLDDFVERTGIIPNAITMDVEGAELAVLDGADATLEQHHPLLWISIHPEMAERHYGHGPHDIFDYLDALGYNSEFLAEDHEEHYFFS